ncbi:META domain-containing protein [Streptomyces flavofungini]|uniref:META domain-containing protein n=1 Tax=Streptomyces flavofungini TaxID=68200 RepID=A0ABS0XHD5_9ACTN|nr:META domain-containing protein [Streptomyces flavofungini]MBJ3812612.1 META domain-containing protein [Streptomyces flavofungini]
MYKQRVTQTLTVLAAAGLLAACGSESGSGDGGSDKAGAGNAGSGKGGSASSLTGVRWNVDSLTVDGKKKSAPNGAYVKFGGKGSAGGNFGCNGYGAKVSVKGDTVDFEPGPHTEIACDALDFEKSLARAMDGKLKADVDDERLTLTTAGGDRIALSAEAGAPLKGTEWTVTSVGTGSTSTSLPKALNDKIKLTFTKDGKVRGNLGCNDVSAAATAADGKIALGQPRATRKMCPGDVMPTERALMKLFGGKAGYELDHRTLTLTAPDGKTTAKAQAPAA